MANLSVFIEHSTPTALWNKNLY